MTGTAWPDPRLIVAAQDGDVDALTALVNGSQPHVRRFALTLCASPQDAEDAAQEALIVLYRRIGTLRATAALASWLFRIVRNECLRHARRIWTPISSIPDISGASAEEQALTRLEAERVATAIAALPADHRRVLVMRDVQGYPGRAVADALGLSVAAMKSRLHRARTAVHETLTNPAGGRHE